MFCKKVSTILAEQMSSIQHLKKRIDVSTHRAVEVYQWPLYLSERSLGIYYSLDKDDRDPDDRHHGQHPTHPDGPGRVVVLERLPLVGEFGVTDGSHDENRLKK